MKKVIVALALIVSIGTTQTAWATPAPKHRYQPTAEQVDKQEDALEAYSDTTSIDTSSSTYANEDDEDSRVHSKYSLRNYDDPFDFIGSVFGRGMLVTMIILCIVFALLFVFAPLIIIFFIVRYMMRRHNDRIKLAEMAMEKGVNVPENERPIYKQSDEYLVKRGLRNSFLGLGLVVMFACWGADFFVGISALVVFYGLGQIFIGCLPVLKQWWCHRHSNEDLGSAEGKGGMNNI